MPVIWAGDGEGGSGASAPWHFEAGQGGDDQCLKLTVPEVDSAMRCSAGANLLPTPNPGTKDVPNLDVVVS